MASTMSKDSSILIVGSGTFGISTAVHLARRGYTNIQCLDRWPCPSADSAGYDINKIISMRNDDPLAEKMTSEAYKGWQDPLFKDVFHEVGLISAATTETPLAYAKAAHQSWIDRGKADKVEWFEGRKDFHDAVPLLSQGSLDGWKGYLQKEAGWAHAMNAVKIMGDEAARMGVKLASGPNATMKSLLLDGNGEAVGIVAVDGTEWRADRVVLSTGAWSDSLLDTKGQLMAKCWTLAHIQLTPEECAEFKDIPVVMNLEEGFFFEPDEYGQVKILNESPGFTHMQKLPDGRTISVPRSHASNPTDTIPEECRAAIRALLARTIPRFQDRPFVVEKICWCTDTMDRNWLIDQHPQHPRLVVATGDSGNAFKMLPVIGRYIGDVVERKPLPAICAQAWRWRPEKNDRSEGESSRWGGDWELKDLKDMAGWKAKGIRSVL